MAKSSAFFDLLDPDVRAQTEARLRTMHVPKGRTVIESSSESNDVYFVTSGELRVLVYAPSGKEVPIADIGAGGMFGEIAALDGAARSASVVAMSDGVLRVLSRRDFRFCLDLSPKAAVWIAQNFSRQIRALNNRLFELATLNVNNRLHFELLRLGLLAGVTDNRAAIFPAPTHGELANRIGTSRELITRELRDLAQRGVIVQDGRRLELVDVDALSKIVQRLSGQFIDSYMAPHLTTDRAADQ
jgi:CRP-like cAMP-binding protein